MSPPDDDAPHYLGHRERLRARFTEVGGDPLPDYELLELILFRSMPRRDVKPVAKDILKRFGSFAEALAAPPQRLMEVDGVGESVATDLKIVAAAARRLTRGAVAKRPVLRQRRDPRPQPSLGRSDPVRRRHRHDARDHRRGEAARHRGA
jgi:DNA repair protein RadC